MATTDHPTRPARAPRTVALALAVVVLGCVGLALAFAERPIWSEGGPIEGLSALLLLVLTIALAWHARARLIRFWNLPLLALALTGRELDLDKRLFDPGLLKLRMYTGDAPLVDKLLAGAVLALLIWAGIRTLRQGWRPLRAALRGPAGWGHAVVVGLLLVVVAKSMDGADRKLRPFGVEFDPRTVLTLGHVEEALELGFALCLLLAAWAYPAARRLRGDGRAS